MSRLIRCQTVHAAVVHARRPHALCPSTRRTQTLCGLSVARDLEHAEARLTCTRCQHVLAVCEEARAGRSRSHHVDAALTAHMRAYPQRTGPLHDVALRYDEQALELDRVDEHEHAQECRLLAQRLRSVSSHRTTIERGH